MKTTVGILAALLLATLSARAESSQPDPQERALVEQRFPELEKRLGLSSEQAEQVRAIVTGMAEITKAVRNDYILAERSPSTRRRLARELRAIRSHADARLKRILSWTQMEELRAILRESRDAGEGVVAAASRTR